jgi:hypothetical protein
MPTHETEGAGRGPSEAPVRSCCGRRHFGPVCPDGRVMCCMCFRRVTQDRLAVLEPGDGGAMESAPILADVCRTCKQREDRWGGSNA